MTRPLVVAEDGVSRWLGVRFRPGGAFPLLRFRLGEATDTNWELGSLWPEADAWAERLALAPSVDDRIGVVFDVLGRKLGQLGSPVPDERVRHATNLFTRTGGTVSTSRLCERLGLSRQHVNRLFDQHVGISMKRFARIARLQSSMRLLRQGPEGATHPRAELAVRAGFFDQAHFIADFKALVGVTPSQFLVEAREQR